MGCFSSSGTVALHVVDGIMNEAKYRDILQKYLYSSVQQLDPRNITDLKIICKKELTNLSKQHCYSLIQ